jgi:hypothetical protein
MVLIAIAVVLTVIAVIALQLEAIRQNHRTGATPSSTCSPQPCADAQGYVVVVRNVDLSPPLLRVQVAFSVRGRGNMHAEPFDFALVDADHTRSRPVFDAPGCPQWPRTNIADGTSFGPQPLCFRPASTRSPLTLSWEPDLGLFSTTFPLQIR